MSESIHDIQARAALDALAEEHAFQRKMWELVGGDRPAGRQRCGAVVRIGDNAVVETISNNTNHSLWAAVADDRSPNEWFEDRDMALLHLLAITHGPRNTRAHEYAARVLAVPYEG